MIIDRWPETFRRLYGGEFPRSYACVDVETSGFDHAKDLITEWGCVLVQDGEVISHSSVYLDWTNHRIVQDDWLRYKLYQTERNMAAQKKPFKTTYEFLQKHGEKPEKALRLILEFLDMVKSRGLLFVAHNAPFDERMICGNFAGFKIAEGFTFGDNGFIDTAAIAKATQVPDHPSVQPRPKDTLRSYFNRVHAVRVTGVRYGLDSYCYREYNFQSHGINPEDMHGAKTDAYCAHLLMKEFAARCGQQQLTPTATHNNGHGVSGVLRKPGQRVRGQRCS